MLLLVHYCSFLGPLLILILWKHLESCSSWYSPTHSPITIQIMIAHWNPLPESGQANTDQILAGCSKYNPPHLMICYLLCCFISVLLTTPKIKTFPIVSYVMKFKNSRWISHPAINSLQHSQTVITWLSLTSDLLGLIRQIKKCQLPRRPKWMLNLKHQPEGLKWGKLVSWKKQKKSIKTGSRL